MDSVQRLRQQAQAAGTLNNTPQQTVSTQGQAIIIQPANPQTIYIPYYNPSDVYGAWPYPDYMPYYFPPPSGYVYFNEGIFGFGIGVPLILTFWDWDYWDWGHHRIGIYDDRFRSVNHGHAPLVSGIWQHNPYHRHGVPYRDAGVQAKFQRVSDEARRNWRGYSGTATRQLFPMLRKKQRLQFARMGKFRQFAVLPGQSHRLNSQLKHTRHRSTSSMAQCRAVPRQSLNHFLVEKMFAFSRRVVLIVVRLPNCQRA